MTGKGGTAALQEVHIFLGPVWDEATNTIDPSIVKRYNNVVNMFNQIMANSDGTDNAYKEMKNPLLALKFVGAGYLTVMQSSLYVKSNSREQVIECAHMLANLFKNAGFTVLREKIEASAYGINNIPQTTEEAQKYNKYFEFHIRVEHASPSGDKIELTSDELAMLEAFSNQFQRRFATPVPLSFNRSTHPDGGYQRYLNVRFRNMGSVEALEKIEEIKLAINQTGTLKVVKVIAEYVWYDTFVALDKGWIDF
jgi:hypothetical protein